MSRLISISTVKTYHQIASGINDTEGNKYIQDAQDFDLKPLMPEKFYVDLINNKDTPEWSIIFNGGTYTYDSFDYEFSGLNKCLASFAASRIVLDSNIISTAFGMKVKTTPNSTEPNYQEKKSKSKQLIIEANQLFDEFKIFMDRNADDYENWICNNKRKIKIKVIQ